MAKTSKVGFGSIQQLRSFLKTRMGGGKYSLIKVKPSPSGKSWNIEAYPSDPKKSSRGKEPFKTAIRPNAETDVDTLINFLNKAIDGKL